MRWSRASLRRAASACCKRQGAQVETVRNDIDANQALDRARQRNAVIILSPRPGGPEDAGCCLDLIRLAKGTIPVLGICLGHQAIVLEAGGDIVPADEIAHGKSSLIDHDRQGPFASLPSPLRVGRYHSLCACHPPPSFTVHARLGAMAMAISDEKALQVGLQFHPESILTPLGDDLLAGSLTWLGAVRAD